MKYPNGKVPNPDAGPHWSYYPAKAGQLNFSEKVTKQNKMSDINKHVDE